MTKDDIIELAREARLGNVLCHNSVEGDRVWIEGADWHDELERFAELLEAKVRADEREACAHMVEDWDLECFNYLACPRVVADAIRARGEK